MRFIPLLFLVLFVTVSNAQTLWLSKRFVNLESAQVSFPSSSDTFSLNMNSFSGDLKLVTTFPFQLSKDNISFNDTLIIPLNQSNVNHIIYSRLVPNQADIVYRGSISFLDGIFTLPKKVYLIGSSIQQSQSLSICSWNMKWFGLESQCNCDTALSRINATSLIKEINADVFALQEVVSEIQLQKLVNELGQNYTYVLSDYCSQITSPSSAGYVNCQKLAYVYNTQKVVNDGVFALLQSTYPTQQSNASPYNYFSSGRWPLVLKARISGSSQNDVFNIVNIHAKAYDGVDEHNRRAGGAVVMTDSLNALFPNKNVVVVGDYNDLLEGAITSGFVLSPYNYMFNNGFKGITLPSLFPGENTYLGSFNSLIDNVVVSDATYPFLIANSTTILKEADFAIDNFKYTTSDHLPVLTFFKSPSAVNTADVIKKSPIFTLIHPNGHELNLGIPNGYQQELLKIEIFSIDGKMIASSYTQGSAQFKATYPNIQQGLYIVRVQSKSVNESIKWLVN